MSYISLFKLWIRERLKSENSPEQTKTVYIAIAKGCLNEVFAQVRTKMNKSGRQGAELLGVHHRTLQHWENGTREIPSATIDLFAYMYSVKLTTKEHGEWIASVPKVVGMHVPIWERQLKRFFRAK